VVLVLFLNTIWLYYCASFIWMRKMRWNLLFEYEGQNRLFKFVWNKPMNIRFANVLVDSPEITIKLITFEFYLQVLRTTLSNRLAKVQGFLFRAAFLRRVPMFLRLITENIVLCFLSSTMQSTSKYITGTLSLHFRKILTKLIHSHYFKVDIVELYVDRNYIFFIVCIELVIYLCIPPSCYKFSG